MLMMIFDALAFLVFVTLGTVGMVGVAAVLIAGRPTDKDKK